MARNYNYVTAQNLARLNEMGLTCRDVAEELGRNSSTVSAWLNNNIMPKDASVACEALLRRRQSHVKNHVVVLRCPDEKWHALSSFLKAINIEYKDI